jgi:hypothetical protein
MGNSGELSHTRMLTRPMWDELRQTRIGNWFVLMVPEAGMQVIGELCLMRNFWGVTATALERAERARSTPPRAAIS